MNCYGEIHHMIGKFHRPYGDHTDLVNPPNLAGETTWSQITCQVPNLSCAADHHRRDDHLEDDRVATPHMPHRKKRGPRSFPQTKELADRERRQSLPGMEVLFV